MSGLYYSRLLSAGADSGRALFQYADALGENYPSSVRASRSVDATLGYDGFVVDGLASCIGVVGPRVEPLIGYSTRLQNALGVLRKKGLEAYRSSMHNVCVSALLRAPELQQSETEPPLLVRLRTSQTEEDLVAALEEIRARIGKRQAWRADVIRSEPMFSHWLWTTCKTISLLPDYPWPVADSVIWLVVKEARAIVAENLVVGSRLPKNWQLLRYSIWHGYNGETLMLMAIDAALNEWIIETDGYRCILTLARK